MKIRGQHIFVILAIMRLEYVQLLLGVFDIEFQITVNFDTYLPWLWSFKVNLKIHKKHQELNFGIIVNYP